MRKIQSSPTREIRNFWQRDAHADVAKREEEEKENKCGIDFRTVSKINVVRLKQHRNDIKWRFEPCKVKFNSFLSVEID